MRDALKSYLALASGLTDVTRQRAVGAAKALVAQGEATAEQVTSLADDLLQQSRSNREAVVALVKYEVDRALGRVGLASNDEVSELTKRVRSLEAQVRELGGTVEPSGGTTTASRAAAARPAAKAPTEKGPAAKAPAKAPVKAAAKPAASAAKTPAKAAKAAKNPAASAAKKAGAAAKKAT